jgi:hypothetical protein
MIRKKQPDDVDLAEVPLNLPLKPKPRKPREPWTEDEERFLIGLICTQGKRWAKFEQDHGEHGDGRLYGRDQVAIKDKARNILRRIINVGGEEELYARYPRWKGVSVGAARRGVHGYMGTIPDLRPKEVLEMLPDEE